MRVRTDRRDEHHVAGLERPGRLLAEHDLSDAFARLAEAFINASGSVIAVSNETGMSVVPEAKLGRDFRNRQGEINQILATKADLVVFVAAGLPLVLKGQMPEMPE